MGLDIRLKRMGKVDNSKVYTYKEFADLYCKDNTDGFCCPHILGSCEEFPDPLKTFEGLTPEYFAKVIMPTYDDTKLLASKGKNLEVGWEWACTCDYDEECKDEIPANRDDLLECIKFSRRDKDDNEIEAVWVVVTKQNEKDFTTPVEFWCSYVTEELGHMRKGANKQFYDDGMWDLAENTHVFSKRVLKEHMEKYFDEEGDERYGNARAVFKREIYDKFKDGEGMYVCYC